MQPVTLGDLARAGKLLRVYCCDCGREQDFGSTTKSATAPVRRPCRQWVSA